MKHAILITAYKDFDSLAHLVKQFDANFNIYIHIDVKSKIDNSALQDILKIANVKCLESKYTVNWGGLNHLKSYMLLCEKALSDKDNFYFHLITGEDYPIQNNAGFNKVLSALEPKKGFLEYFEMPSTEWENGGMSRLEQYNLFDVFNAKTSLGLKWIHFIQRIQGKLNFKRSIDFKQDLYGGSTYWSLPRNMIQFVIDFTNENPEFLKRFKHTFCAEEIYFQTLLLNSEHAENIINDNLRFIDWESGKGGFPAFLDEEDYESIIKSNQLFARKITSSGLKQRLADYREVN